MGGGEHACAYKGKDSSKEAFDESLWLNFIVRSFSRLGAFCTKSALLIVGGNLIPFGYLDIPFFQVSLQIFSILAQKFFFLRIVRTKIPCGQLGIN